MPNPDGAELFADLPGASRSSGYRLPYEHYAMHIWPGKDPENASRTIKRWVKVGREANDPPPLDDLPSLADWYERHHKWKAGRELAALRDGVPVTSPAPAPAPKAAPAPPPPASAEEESLPAMVFDLDVELSVDTGLRQIRSLVQATYDQMQLAIKGSQMKQYQTLRREWSESIKLLRQWEKDVVKIQEGRGEVLRTRVINTELVQIFTSLGQSFFQAMDNLLAVHAPEMPAAERWKVAIERRDRVFAHLARTRFAAAWEPESGREVAA